MNLLKNHANKRTTRVLQLLKNGNYTCLSNVEMPPSKGQSSSQTKQQTTISSFFTPKQTASSTSAKPKAAPAKAAPVPVAKGESLTNFRSSVKKTKEAEDATDSGEQAGKISTRKGRITRAPPKSRKRNLELSDDEVAEDGVEDRTGKFTKGRKRLRGSPSNQTSGRGEEEEIDKENESQDVEMTDVEMACDNTKLCKATSKLSVSKSSSQKSLKGATKEKTGQFAYNPSQEPTSSTTAVDLEYAKQKAKLREKFIQKLGKSNSIDEITRARGAAVGEDDGDESEDGGEDIEEEEEVPKPKGKKAQGKPSAPKKGKSKLTPLEKQVVDIKMQYPDTILVVEVGYKYRFFGDDARIASKELSIMCIPGKMRFDEHPSEAHLDKFASASIPVHRLHVHVKRLVAAGHKVGVVRQLETAALKAVGDNRNAPFTRKLTNLYTKGTYVDDIDGFDDVAGVGTSAPATGYLLCLTEKLAGGMGTDEKVNVGIIAVQPSTGDVIYDEFEDGFMRSEIETRLLHIAPCELLIVGELSKATEKLVTHLAGST